MARKPRAVDPPEAPRVEDELAELELEPAELAGGASVGDLTEADLTGVRIDRCELRGCTLDGLVGMERLRGAAMPWADIVGYAGLLAAALGIRVLEDDSAQGLQ